MSTPTDPQDPYSSQPPSSGGYGAPPPPPGGGYGGPPPPPAPYGGPGGFSGAEKNNLGTWALVLGILSIVCCGFFAGIPAVILGNKSKEAQANGLANNGNLGNIGMILGWIGIAFGVIGLIIGALNGFNYSAYYNV